jgi:hypothetical protein
VLSESTGTTLPLPLPIQNGLKEGDDLLPFSFGKDLENHERLEMNGTHLLLVFADDVTILSERISTLKCRNSIRG